MMDLGTFVGALVATFLLSRAVFWMARAWPGGLKRILTGHYVSLLTAGVIAAYGMADGNAPNITEGLWTYLPAQFCWLVIDTARWMLSSAEPLDASAAEKKPHRKRNWGAARSKLFSVALWTLGIIGFGILGAVLQRMSDPYGGAAGFFGGALAFAVARMWWNEARSQKAHSELPNSDEVRT